MSAELVKLSSMTLWYTKLNQMRTKRGLGTITVPTTSGVAKASDMNTLNTNINNLKTDAYLNYATYKNSSVTGGSLIRLVQKTNIDDTFASLEQICANNSRTTDTDYTLNSNYSTGYCSTNSNYGNNSDKAKYSDGTSGNNVSYNSTNSANSTPPWSGTLAKTNNTARSTNSTNSNNSYSTSCSKTATGNQVNTNNSDKSTNSVDTNYSVASNSVNTVYT